LCGIPEEVTSRERADGKGDSRILADIELLREKEDDLKKLDEEIPDLLLRADMRQDELEKEMRAEFKHYH